MSSISIVEYFSEHSGYRCGYCKSTDGNYSRGMWAHKLAPLDYQHLIDRGWRRSGQYCYKPSLTMTCCPQYAIRCEALKFQPTKSQKKLLKRVHKFLAYGKSKDTDIHQIEKPEADGSTGDSFSDYPDSAILKQIATKCEKNLQNKCIEGVPVAGDMDKSIEERAISSDFKDDQIPKLSEHIKSESRETTKHTCTNSGIGADPDKPPCKKAKLLRKEKKLKKLVEKAKEDGKQHDNIEELLKNQKRPTVKSLEDFLNEPLPKNPAHNLKIKVVKMNPTEVRFGNDFDTSYQVYKSYQMKIHKETESECDKETFINFLISSPILQVDADSTSDLFPGFGSFHQQYWLDDRLIAVGVIDILPYCISSVYLYYDPEFSFLSLGTYATLRELAFTKQLQHYVKDLKYYYMGFYIHSCPKMKYKGQYIPSYLLCPETYGWFPIERCRPKLDISKYCRFEEDARKEDQDGIIELNEVEVLHSRQRMPYAIYLLIKRDNSQDAEVSEYARLVGKKCYSSMLLYRA